MSDHLLLRECLWSLSITLMLTGNARHASDRQAAECEITGCIIEDVKQSAYNDGNY